MTILALSGSLRRASLNAALLRAAATLAPAGVDVALFDGLGELPPFNPDLDPDASAAVRRFRGDAAAADAVLIASPEYAHGVTGVLKNALDWLVAGGELSGKAIAVLNASPWATLADAALREILRAMDARLVEAASVRLPLPGGTASHDVLADPRLAGPLRSAVATLAAAPPTPLDEERPAVNRHSILSQPPGPLPPDDLQRDSKLADPDAADAPHLGVVGDTYTVLLSGDDTDGRYCLIDMHVPPGGGPPPHRHDFEESFTVLDGEIEATFRGRTTTVTAGWTLHVPANAPHAFTNASDRPARLLCTCAPAGQEAFFAQIGVPVPGRTTPPPKPTAAEATAMKEKAERLAPKYRTEML